MASPRSTPQKPPRMCIGGQLWLRATQSAIQTGHPLEIFAGAAWLRSVKALEPLRDLARPQAALYIGGMGATGQKNFYNDIFSKSGYAEEAKLIQDLYLAGEKKSRGRGHSRRLPSQKFSDWQREFCKGASAGTQSLWCDRPECKSRRKDASGACRSMR